MECKKSQWEEGDAKQKGTKEKKESPKLQRGGGSHVREGRRGRGRGRERGRQHLSLGHRGNGTPLHSVINFENGKRSDVLARTHTHTNKRTHTNERTRP